MDQSNPSQTQPATTTATYDIQNVKTKSGKTIANFIVPPRLMEKDQELIMLIMRSEAMNDEEKQYWFNLTEVMNEDQMAKLYDILRRERKKLEEIDGKSTSKPPVDPVEAKKRADEQAQKRKEEADAVKKKEQASESQENEDAILSGFDKV